MAAHRKVFNAIRRVLRTGTGWRDQRAQRQAKGRRAERPPRCGKRVYRRRNVIARCLNRLKQCRRVATRYDKHAVRYRAFVVLAAINLWLLP